ncbi:MAG: peptide deformylase [Paracoccaceae bacterium]
MMALPILTWPDPRLSAPSAPVGGRGDALAGLLSDMFETMYAAGGRGLAAPQVGVLSRVFVMDEGWKRGAPDPQVFVNPVILSRSEEMAEGPEGCLSIPGLTVPVARHLAVRLAWEDIGGQACGADLAGFTAICAQHEIDHLDGIVTLDRVSPELRAELLTGYGG